MYNQLRLQSTIKCIQAPVVIDVAVGRRSLSSLGSICGIGEGSLSTFREGVAMVVIGSVGIMTPQRWNYVNPRRHKGSKRVQRSKVLAFRFN